MANETIVDQYEIIPYNMDEIEVSAKDILLNQGFTDIQYPGSNLSQLSTVMSYLIYTLNTNTAINLKEVMLPLATKPDNIKWGARHLGYEPKQRISYIYELNILVEKNPQYGQEPNTPNYDTDFRVVLPKYSAFNSGSNTYYYLGQDIEILTSNEKIDNGDPSASFSIEVKEGILNKFEDNDLLRQRSFLILDANGESVVKQNYLIPLKNVEQYGLETFLTYVDEDGITHFREYWEQSESFLIDNEYFNDVNSYARMQNIYLNTPEIYFKIGGIGKGIRLNTLIETNVLQSNGVDGICGDYFTIQDGTLASLFKVNGYSEVQRGQNEESSKSIKENAPIMSNTGNRLVTAKDYVAFSRKHEKVNKSVCWGAEDETARDRGYVYLAMTPERTVREFESVKELIETPNDPTNDNELSVDNLLFYLQNTPRHPYANTTHGLWHMGNDDDNGAPPTPYPEKDDFEINDTWEITFNDTNGDGSLDIYGGDLDGVMVYLGDILYLDDDGSGNKVFTKRDKGYITRENHQQMMNWYLDPVNDIKDEYLDKVDNTKVLSYLKPYQIMSIKTFFRQPVYFDFNLEVNIVQTTLNTNDADRNKLVFDIIDAYFRNEVEDFEKIFLMSTLISKINEYISDINGINIDINTEMSLNQMMYDDRFYSYDNQKIIYSTLAFPFERIYDIDTQELNPKYLPKMFGSDDYPLFADFENFWTGDGTETPKSSHDVIVCPIHKGTDNTGEVVGYYFIRNSYIKSIEIQLFFSDDGTIKSTPQGDFSRFVDLSLKPLEANIKEVEFFTDTSFGYNKILYPGVNTQSLTDYTKGENIPFKGYTIPRLKSVKFIKGNI
jgi:hypothetical protein